jgi:hypothetical protein
MQAKLDGVKLEVRRVSFGTLAGTLNRLIVLQDRSLSQWIQAARTEFVVVGEAPMSKAVQSTS